jgi:hypothetical protein
MKRLLSLAAIAVLFAPLVVSAQRPADAPATAPAGKPPDTIFIEDLTWAEVRDLVAAGTTNVIIGTAGTEQKGPHMVDGEHKFVMEYAADKVARALGKTLVAPVITYVPEGSWTNPGGHMGKPGTITLPDDRFVELLVAAGRSLKSGTNSGPTAAPRRSGSAITTRSRTTTRTPTSPPTSASPRTRSAVTPTSSTRRK